MLCKNKLFPKYSENFNNTNKLCPQLCVCEQSFNKYVYEMLFSRFAKTILGSFLEQIFSRFGVII